ncbi:transporter [Ganoderma sinense ZZ0214-1]|uniref:Transporter n=1 Tax=Ganoderma sinense ZZ0214-1 TaxID=1077348 RepID=A0A2G8SV73_9APHY|nr:transporter [Ganoderma sinense ZZ0214-1]
MISIGLSGPELWIALPGCPKRDRRWGPRLTQTLARLALLSWFRGPARGNKPAMVLGRRADGQSYDVTAISPACGVRDESAAWSPPILEAKLGGAPRRDADPAGAAPVGMKHGHLWDGAPGDTPGTRDRWTEADLANMVQRTAEVSATEIGQFHSQRPPTTQASVGYQLLLSLSSQMIGYPCAGIVFQLLVSPSSMIWPSALVSSVPLDTLSCNSAQKTKHVSREKSFLLIPLTRTSLPASCGRLC